MGEFLFVVKCMVASIFMLMLMQTPVKQLTVEEHFENWMIESKVGINILETADATVVVAKNLAKKIEEKFFSDPKANKDKNTKDQNQINE